MASNDPHAPNDPEGKHSVMTPDSAAARRSRIGASRGLDARSQEAIGKSLKAHYDDLVRAPIPERFMELLDRLEAKEQAPASHGGEDASD
jgi:hypothetical protein